MARVSSAPTETMNRISSARSLGTASSHRSQASDMSTFEMHLPRVTEHIEMRLSRGMRWGLSSECAGAGKMAKVCEETGVTYNVTVEPNGRRMNLKEIDRMELRDLHGDAFELGVPEVRFNDVMMDAIVDERHDRGEFRKERLRKFNTHRFMPALVTERLVPCWRAGMGAKPTDQMTPAEEFKQRIKEACEAANVNTRGDVVQAKTGKKDRTSHHQQHRGKDAFVMPTVSVAMKRQLKAKHRRPDRTWRVSGVLDVHEALHPPVRVFDSGGIGPVWEELEKERALEHKRSKKDWLSHDVVPSGIAAPSSEEVDWIREESKNNLQTLRSEYKQRRDKHQRGSTSNRGESSFEKFFQSCKAKAKTVAEEAVKAAAAEKVQTAKPFDLSLGIALSKAPVEARGADLGLTAPQSGT